MKRTTIRKFCVDVLRQHGARIKVDPGFGIADDDYQTSHKRQLSVAQIKALRRVLGIPADLLLE